VCPARRAPAAARDVRSNRRARSRRIFNNTLFENAYHEIAIQSSSASFPILEIKNNVICALPANYGISDASGDRITAHGHNLFCPAGAADLVRDGSSRYAANDLGSWESTALAADPQLKDPANLPGGFTGTFGQDLRPDTDGLALSSSSPGIDQGAALDPAFASSINSVARPGGAAWDVGAYEQGDPPPTAPSAPTGLRVVE
jgi:hypothetical protein